ncbi:MAG: protoporphyrinogen oxidase, partial [Alphaproteobacteria bacterium]
VLVLERQVRAGGNAVSERFDGFLMEHGPSSVSAASSHVAALSRSLGLDRLRTTLGADVRYRYLVGAGGLCPIPTHPLGFLVSGYLSPAARLRVLAEPLVQARRSPDEETVDQFWRRRFGGEFADRVIDPLVGGLYAARAAETSMVATFPALVDMERRYGSVVAGVLRRVLAGRRMPARRLYSWADGIGTLPGALANRLGQAVRTGVAVRRVKPVPGGFRVEAGKAGALTARCVVIATQPHVGSAILEDLDCAAADAAAGIHAPPLAVVFLGYRREQVAHPLDGIGYLTAENERRSLLGALFCSTMFAGRAPEGHVALAAYVGGARSPALATLEQEELIALARMELRELVGAEGRPLVARVRQWPRGLPQYRLGHAKRVAALREAEDRLPGLFMTGNYIAGPSVATCAAQACETAARVHRHLAQDAYREVGAMGGRLMSFRR